MCGITGFWSAGSTGADPWDTVREMADALRHRGPDADGTWVDPEAGIALGHRRLSIVDLSDEGRQPMASASGRYVVAFNGEVYNFERIRARLREDGDGTAFRGHSDTEVILAAVERWGLERAVREFVGMFAIALWDRAERRLYLVRDRMGIKPLFYGFAGGTLLFGSELKALRAHPSFRGEVSREALGLFLRFNCVPGPHSIYRGIHKLPPGTILTVAAPDRPLPEPVAYWSAAEVAERGVRDPFRGSDAEAADALDALLRDAVGLRMVADVPLGAFLSGGVDSSTVVALMQAQSSRPVRTFSIGFHEKSYDEAEHARAVATHLGTEHTELYVQPREALDVIPRLPTMYDEPFADSSQIPTFLVSQLARRHVTVSLSGDGGDELFGGYNRHEWGQAIWRRIGRFPRGLRGAAAQLLTAVPAAGWDRAFAAAGPFLPARARVRTPGYKLHKMAGILGVDGPDAMYARLASHWSAEDSPVLGAGGGHGLPAVPALGSIAERMMFMDMVTYLPNDILTKVDRASMAVALEARVPLIDHRVVEFAWRLPLEMKLRGGTGKWLLRQVLHRYVPRALIERPKMGFGIPLGAWLRGPLRPWAEELLDERRMADEGLLAPGPVRRRWEDHLAGRGSWEYHLWDVLMFQAWLREQSATVGAAV